MNPYCSNRERYSCNVEVKESLVESVADGRWRVQQDENKRGRALELPVNYLPFDSCCGRDLRQLPT